MSRIDSLHKKTALLSVSLGVLYTLMLSYDIAGSYDTVNERVVSGLSSYGFDKCLISVGLGSLIYLIMTRLKNFRLRDYKGMILIAAVFGFLNTSGIYMYYQDAMPRTLSGIVLFAAYVLAFAFAFCLAWKVFCYAVQRIGASAKIAQMKCAQTRETTAHMNTWGGV